MEDKVKAKVNTKVKQFCYRWIKEIRSISETLSSLGIDIKLSLPHILTQKTIFYECVFSEDRKHVLVLLKSSGNFDYQFTVVKGDVFNYFDKSGLWQKMPVGIKMENCRNIRFGPSAVRGCKPLEIVGDDIELFINNLSIDIPFVGPTMLEYVLVMSYPVFLDRLKSARDLARDIVMGYFKYFQINGIMYSPSSTQASQYKQYLETIKLQMGQLFFNDNIYEREIDKFIENNPIILEHCLDLVLVIHQVELKDLVKKYGQNLKPDLIGYRQDKKQWAIVDYKRAKRTIIKNSGQVRTSFRAEVSDLQAQLKDYREYFQEHIQRQYCKETYGHDIEFPTTIGVIGRIAQTEIKDFNRLQEDLPRWIDIVPYNYMYDRFSRFIDTVNKLS